MTDLNSVAMHGDGVSISLGDWLTHLKWRGRLLPLLREVALERLVAQQATQAGLAVTGAEQQAAADAFRHRQGLFSAADTRAWLARQGLTGEDFARSLEADLLAEKLKDHLTRDRIAGHFTTHRDRYDRARLRQLVAPREDLAREMLSQFRDEDRDFSDLARELAAVGVRGGEVRSVFRQDLPPALAEAAFAARPGDVVGPVATPEGFHLLLVEEIIPASLDPDAAARIRQELLDAWLAERLQAARLEFPLLEML
jgi:parvulin-like peptidyl-prolyl isomerase